MIGLALARVRRYRLRLFGEGVDSASLNYSSFKEFHAHQEPSRIYQEKQRAEGRSQKGKSLRLNPLLRWNLLPSAVSKAA